MSLSLKEFIYKKFSKNIPKKGGRNRLGRITVQHRVLSVQKKENMLI